MRRVGREEWVLRFSSRRARVDPKGFSKTPLQLYPLFPRPQLLCMSDWLGGVTTHDLV